MSTLIELYQNYCSYKIKDNIQLLDFDIDIETLRRNMFDLIATNDFSYHAVSLRVPKNQDNYIDPNEILEATGIQSYAYSAESTKIDPLNTTHNNQYLKWHPDLENSYITKLVPQLEELCGFSIGRIRLGWLMPDCGYPMHWDLEPMRLHIPLITNNSVYFIHDNKMYTMEYGKLYHLITTGIHTAWNFGQLPRLHLIFSTYGDDALTTQIDKLGNLELLQKNFINHIPAGIDDITLSFLLKLSKSNEKAQTIHNLKLIRNLLLKKNQ